jgi:intracellular multiplication protein IcmE
MASRKENLKSLMTNARTRVIIIFTVVVLVFGLIIGFFKLSKIINPVQTAAGLKETPGGISSTPGAINQTAEYARLQNEQNNQNAQVALKNGTSAIPTIIDLKVLGNGVTEVGPKQGTGSVGFSTLANLDQGVQKPLWLDELQNRQCDKSSLANAVNNGATMEQLKENCSCEKLKDYGFELIKLSNICKCAQLRLLGFTALDFKNIGYSAEKERVCGFSACEAKAAGFSASDMKNGGYSDGELQGAGFDANQISAASGIPSNMTAADIKAAGCSVDALKKLRAQGVSAAAIRRISGCDLAALKAAGYTAGELKDAGFTAAELKAAGFDADALRKAGFSPRELLDAGFTPEELANAGYSDADIADALKQMAAGLSPADIKNNGCSIDALKKERLAGVGAADIVKYSGCSLAALKAAGYTPEELAAVGLSDTARSCQFSAVINAGCDINKLQTIKSQGYSAALVLAVNHCDVSNLKQAGFTIDELLGAGIAPQQLLTIGYLANDIENAYQTISKMTEIGDEEIRNAACDSIKLARLKRLGVDSARIQKFNKCSAKNMKDACFSVGEILSAGLGSDDILKAGFSQTELSFAQNVLNNPPNRSGISIKNAGCDAKKIAEFRQIGVQAVTIESLNRCSAGVFKSAGYCASDLLASGFGEKELASIGFSVTQIQLGRNRVAGIASELCPSLVNISNAGIKAAGCDPAKLAQLRKNGVTVKQILAINKCSLDALKKAGFSAQDLLDAGFTPAQLAAAGFSPAEIGEAQKHLLDALTNGKLNGCSVEAAKAARQAGISAAVLRKTMGCSAATLLQAGYTPKELKEAGFTAGELARAGVPLSELLKAGFTPSELKAAGFSAKDLLANGVSPADLLAAGFKPDELLAAGVTPRQLLDAGVDPETLKRLGLDAKALKNAGLSATQLKSAGFGADELTSSGLSNADLLSAGFVPKSDAMAKVAALNSTISSSLANVPGAAAPQNPNLGLDNLKTALQEQKKQQAALRFQQKIEDKTTNMLSYSTQLMQSWKDSPQQTYVSGTPPSDKSNSQSGGALSPSVQKISGASEDDSEKLKDLIVKTGDIVFAVIDSAVNSDEPSPILATIVSGPLKGSKLIGAFNLPSNADKMVITFTTLSARGISKTISISAYAIDPNTGRTALSSSTNHHYLERYGALFASTFLEGFGNAFQSADTTITIGGTGGTGGPNSTTVQNGIGRSLTSNAVIGLATVGKAWGQQAQRNMNIPTTVQVFSGTPIGVLFLQDVTIDPNQTK